MRSKILVAAALAGALALGAGAGTVFAAGGQPQMPHKVALTPLVTTANGLCSMATTASRGFTPLGSGFVPSVAVTITKRCVGPITALLTAQSFSNDTNGFVSVYATAKCVGKGGFAHPCTLGAVHQAQPASSGNDECLSCYANNYQANAINLSWASLPAGVYKIQVYAGGSSINTGIGWRTLQAIAWSRG